MIRTISKMPPWYPDKYKDSIKVHTDKTIKILKSKGIEIIFEDENPKLSNLTFIGNGKTIKMSHHSFYRYSGRIMKPVPVGKQGKDEKNDYGFGELPIEEYMEGIIVPIILTRLNIKK